MGRHTRSSDGKKQPVPNYRVDEEDEDVIEGGDGEQTPEQRPEPGGPGTSKGKSVKSRRSSKRRRDKEDHEEYDHAKFQQVQRDVGKILEILQTRDVGNEKGKKRTPSRKRAASKSTQAAAAKRRRLVAEFEDSEYTEESEGDSEDEDSGGDPEDDGVKRIKFDMEAMTGKPAKLSKSKSRAKYKYPRPYMYLTREVLEDVKDRVSYDKLSYQEYVWGIVRLIISTHKKDDTTGLLLNHLEMVAEDAVEFKWESVRAFSNACFDKADRKELTWRSEVKIREQRIKHSWISGPKVAPQPTPCHNFNVQTCDKEDGHEEGGIKARHRCALCWFAVGLKECTHPARLCNRKAGLSQRQGNNSYAPQGQGGYKHNQYQKNKGGQGSNTDSLSKEKSHPKN